jgi:hypothetical protein
MMAMVEAYSKLKNWKYVLYTSVDNTSVSVPGPPPVMT